MADNTEPVRTDKRFEAALERFDKENAQDPNTEHVNGEAIPRELAHARRLHEWVLKLSPDASEELQLAARCQHIRRWSVPRDSYEMSRTGYLKWRAGLKEFHAEHSGKILRELGFPEDTISKVQALNRKEGFPANPETRVMEDALCLVFLQFQFAELATRTPEDKMITVLRKTWKKMSTAGRQEALALPYGDLELSLIARAELSL
ncbi:MAG: DUF4202 domain-containing protein [Verrucomicrobia bacterium]|nr:DUF4202 domain-containing protein [Verrucomicrobiota bacterium]